MYIKPGSGSYGTIQFKRADAAAAYYDHGTRKWTSGEIVNVNTDDDASCSTQCELAPHCIGWTRYSSTSCRLTYELSYTFDEDGAIGSGTTNAMSFTSPTSGSTAAGNVYWSHSSGTTLNSAATFSGGLAFPTVLGSGARPITQIFRSTTTSINSNHRFTCSGTSWADIIVAVPSGGNIDAALGTSDSRRMVYNVVYRGSNTCEITFVNGGKENGHMTAVGNSNSVSAQGSPKCFSDSDTSRGSMGDSSYRDLSVQCCSSASMSASGSRQPCQQGVNYNSAASTCSSRGLQLCSLAQVQANIGAGSGCSHDSRHVWTSTECTLYAGPNGDTYSASSSTLNSATLNSWDFNWLAIRISGTGN